MKQFFYPKKTEPELEFERGILKEAWLFVGFVFILFFSLQSDRKQQVIAEQKKKKFLLHQTHSSHSFTHHSPAPGAEGRESAREVDITLWKVKAQRAPSNLHWCGSGMSVPDPQ